MATQLAMYWIGLRVCDPKSYAKLDKAYRKKNRKKIQQRVKKWKNANRKRYNAYRRERYAKMKKETV